MHKRILLAVVLVAVMSAGLLGGASTVQAEKKKPKPQPIEYLIVVMKDVIISSYQTAGSQGPDLTLDGRLNLLSQALLDDGDTPIGYRLQTNLMDAFALNADGTEAYVAAGSSDGVPPADCVEPCLPPFWTLTFRQVPMGPAGQSAPAICFDRLHRVRS